MTLRKTAVFALAIALSLAFLAACRKAPSGAALETWDQVYALFKDPPAEYRSAPLWVWNDRMTNAQIDEQLADFKARGLGGVFVHPRPGLITPYLSEEWLSLFKHAVDAGKSLGLKIWIYDENSYPSGFAGGHVPAAMPEAVRSGLHMRKMSELPASFDPPPAVVLRRAGEGFEDITARFDSGSFGAGEYWIFDIHRQKPSPWYGGFTYVDLMRRDVTEKFLEITLEAYKRVAGAEFGGVVPGSFQDEAEINPAGGRGMAVANYTPALFEAFAKKWGYDLRPHLPSIYEDTGDWRRVRHDFYATLLDLFIDNWAKPYYDYCERNNLVFTGHYWEHEWPRPVVNPDNLALAAYAHMPGIDILMNEFGLDPHAQFGNARAVKEIRSAANQMGRRRTMSETFGAGGWDMTFFDQKRIADWEFALGVNFINQHLSYATIMGARKRDHPPAFTYHEPWWPLYNVLADYYGRLSVAMSAGRQDNRILVLEPTTTAWMHHAAAAPSDKIGTIGLEFQYFIHALEAAQVEYDLASENTLRDFGSVKGRTFRVGRADYDLVVLPPAMENIDAPTLALLEKYLGRGGRVLCWGGPPAYLDGRPDGRLRDLASSARSWTSAGPPDFFAKLREAVPPALEFAFEGMAEGDPNLFFHHRRTLADAELVLLVNTDSREGVRGVFLAEAESCDAWDAFAGCQRPYPFRKSGDRLAVEFDLPAGGSLLLCLKPEARPSPPLAEEVWEDVDTPPSKIARVSDNVLTLDYCDLTLGGTTEKDLYFYEAQLRTFRAHGLDRNPWDSAVQFKTNIIDRDVFPSDSGFEATFHFDVAPGLEARPFAVVVERPHLFRVFINGRETSPEPGRWWLDKAFGVYTPRAWRTGRNAVTLSAKPFTIHTELEPVYIVGDFALRPERRGFSVAPSAALGLGGWAGQGLPMYGREVAYAKTVIVPEGALKERLYAAELGRWLGAAAEVRVDGRTAGVIVSPPYRLDLTAMLEEGRANEVEVRIYGTLKNTLGPFHNDPPLGRAWPGSFQQGAKGGRPPGSAYAVVGYGLFEDFKVTTRRR
ncbi:MAG: hypothetical protein FJY82_07010 [Candidatus Aminicenantes bacterium]|nr:hypothetical protein [Candidatus Aminicenantes bacterium]